MIDKKLALVIVLLSTWFSFTLGLCITHAQEAHVSEQFAFFVDHEVSPGRYVVEPKEVRIGYTITPMEGEHPAPLLVNHNTICRQYSEGMHLFLRCGLDRYAIQSIGLVPKKQKKGKDGEDDGEK